jgi:hypothetical protein
MYKTGTVMAVFMLGLGVGFLLCSKMLISDNFYIAKQKSYDILNNGGSNEVKN